MDHIKKMLESELDTIGTHDNMSMRELDLVYKIVDILKDIYTIEAMDARELKEPTSYIR